jgi:RNA polymerase sigma-70 factor (ECF subfamily)
MMKGGRRMLYIYLAMIDSPEEKRKFEQLYLLYHGHMLRVAQKILRDEQLAEDAVHETFLRIMNDMTKIGDVACHQTRAYAVIKVRGIALNILRARRKIIEMPFEELIEDTEGYMEYEVASEISDEELHVVLAQLPPIHRDVLYLMYFEDMSVRDIARHLDLSESAVKKRLERARNALQAVLAKERVESE